MYVSLLYHCINCTIAIYLNKYTLSHSTVYHFTAYRPILSIMHPNRHLSLSASRCSVAHTDMHKQLHSHICITSKPFSLLGFAPSDTIFVQLYHGAYRATHNDVRAGLRGPKVHFELKDSLQLTCRSFTQSSWHSQLSELKVNEKNQHYHGIINVKFEGRDIIVDEIEATGTNCQ